MAKLKIKRSMKITMVWKLTLMVKPKKKMENYLINFSKNKNYIPIIFRLPGIVGKNSKNNFISSVIKNAKNKKEVRFSNPEFKFNNLIHVKNIAEIIRIQ